MQALQEVLVFAGQTLIIVVGLAVLILLIAAMVARSSRQPELEIERLDRRIRRMGLKLKSFVMAPKEYKKLTKQNKKDQKEDHEVTTFVVDFKGDVKASPVECLREEVSAIVAAARPGDDVVVRLESPGGMVHSYGLAASQLVRLKDAGLQVTACVDRVAASGGYLMACTAHRIVAAPFAIVGSIGVVAQVPNFHRLLRKHDVDYKEYTAGEFKRTISILGEVTAKGEQKFKEELEDTHVLFKDFVKEHRPTLDIAKVATGEHWYGQQALGLNLVDAISTSDDVLMKAADSRRVVHVKFHKKQAFNEKLSGMLGRSIRRGFLETLEELETRRWF